jgi:multicomponent Na+:H+ antiporter subunit A
VILAVVLGAMAVLALVVNPIARHLGRDTGYVLAVAFLVLAVPLVSQVPVLLDGGAVTMSWSWMPALGVRASLSMDMLSLIFCVLVLGVGALVMAYCARYLSDDEPHSWYYVLLTLFAGAMLGLVLAADVILLFVFWELTTICSFFLIGGAKPQAAKPATRALLVTATGGVALLAAAVLLSLAAGTTDLTAILADPGAILASPLAGPAGALIIVAAFTKSAQLPVHFWLPDAMVAITPVSAYLHAATMVKAGIYLLMRFTRLYGDQPAWRLTLISVGLVTAVTGAIIALRQVDLKALLAYSTVSQLGLLVATTGVGTDEAVATAILHTFAHALFKATLFMLVGIIDKEAGSRDIRQLIGLRRVMPITATLTGMAALSLAGLPPTIGFVSKEEIFASMTELPGWYGFAAGALAVTASALTFAYGMRIFYDAFGGPTIQSQLTEPPYAFLAPAAVPAILGVVLGPGVVLLNKFVAAATINVGRTVAGPPFEFWHGWTVELAMTGVVILVGTALFLARDPVDRFLHRSPTPPPGREVFDRGYNAILRFGHLVGRPGRYHTPTGHLLRPLLVLGVLGAAGALTIPALPPIVGDPVRPGDWWLIAILVLCIAGLVTARSAVGAAGLLGVTGFVVAFWFLLAGAPDVALTLLLVEVLTVVVAVLVLRVLPRRLPATPPLGVTGGAVLAVVAGLIAAGGTYALTGRREISPAGEGFLRAAEPETGGQNVVNTILVDFRALDTLGEITVLAAIALGLVAFFRRRTARPAAERAADGDLDEVTGVSGNPVLAHAFRVLTPFLLLLSAYLFLRGHDEPGGGFISALVAGSVAAFAYMIQAANGTAPLAWLRPEPLLAAGLLLAAGMGALVMAFGEPFLTPMKGEVPVPLLGPVELSSSLVFDLGVYLVVVGLVVAAVDRLGVERSTR